MKALTLLCYAFGNCAAMALLPGCDASQAQLGGAGTMPRSVVSVLHPERSWMEPGAKEQPLLYVPDFLANAVDVYTYPAGKFVGRLTGFSGPQGECVDKAQNIWITEEASAQIVEYAHGGTTSIATLSDPGLDPLDCSVDPTSGDLAVTNYSEPGSSDEGSVAIYAGASGSPELHSDGRYVFHPYFCGYDNQGNLFLDGTQFPYSGFEGQFQYAELPKGSSTFTNLTLQPSKQISWPGGIHWDGSHMALADLTQGVIYRLSGAKVVQTIQFQGARGAIDFFAQGKRVVIGLDRGAGALGLWNYPSGGAPIKMLKLPDRRDPVALSVISN